MTSNNKPPGFACILAGVVFSTKQYQVPGKAWRPFLDMVLHTMQMLFLGEHEQHWSKSGDGVENSPTLFSFHSFHRGRDQSDSSPPATTQCTLHPMVGR